MHSCNVTLSAPASSNAFLPHASAFTICGEPASLPPIVFVSVRKLLYDVRFDKMLSEIFFMKAESARLFCENTVSGAMHAIRRIFFMLLFLNYVLFFFVSSCGTALSISCVAHLYCCAYCIFHKKSDVR